MSEYAYKNSDDTVRFKIWKKWDDNDPNWVMWDVDIFYRNEEDPDIGGFKIETCGTEYGDDFFTRREAKEWAENKFGKVKSFNPGNMVEGWENEEAKTQND